MPRELSPAFQFYPRDWLASSSIAVMRLDERGAYITLLARCWLLGELPTDNSQLASLAGATLSWWRTHGATVMRPFQRTETGYRHDRLDAERAKQAEWATKSQEGGQASAEARRLKYGSSQPRTKRRTTHEPPFEPPFEPPREPRDEPTANSSSSSSSASSSSKSTPPNGGGSDAAPADFAPFWEAWPSAHRVGRKQAVEQWRKLSPEERGQAVAAVLWRVEHDTAWQGPRPDGQWAIPHPFRYLRDKRFTDAQHDRRLAPIARPCPRCGNPDGPCRVQADCTARLLAEGRAARAREIA